MGQKKIFRKLARTRGLLQHFNENGVLVDAGRNFTVEKPNGQRIKTGQSCPEIFNYRFDY